MKALVGLMILVLTTGAFAQSTQPKGNAKAAVGCKFVGTVKGPSFGLETARTLRDSEAPKTPRHNRFRNELEPQFRRVKSNSSLSPQIDASWYQTDSF